MVFGFAHVVYSYLSESKNPVSNLFHNVTGVTRRRWRHTHLSIPSTETVPQASIPCTETFSQIWRLVTNFARDVTRPVRNVAICRRWKIIKTHNCHFTMRTNKNGIDKQRGSELRTSPVFSWSKDLQLLKVSYGNLWHVYVDVTRREKYSQIKQVNIPS